MIFQKPLTPQYGMGGGLRQTYFLFKQWKAFESVDAANVLQNKC